MRLIPLLCRFLIWALCFTAACGITPLGRSGVVMQSGRSDCGAAALSMILDYYGRHYHYGGLVKELETTSVGATMWNLKEAASRRGLECAGWRLAPHDLDSIPLPAILFLRRGHFVVLDGCVFGGDCLVRDPARGRLRIARARLRSLWSGETLLFHPTGSLPGRHGRWFGRYPQSKGAPL